METTVGSGGSAVTKTIGQAGDLYVSKYYETHIEYKPLGMVSYKISDYDRKVALRVQVLPLGTGINGYDAASDDAKKDFIDVVEDLAWYTWISFFWFAGMILISILAAVVESFDLVSQVDANGKPDSSATDNTLRRAIRVTYTFITSFESHEATMQFLRNIGLGAPSNMLESMAARLIRGLMSLVREGFSIFVAAVAISYAYVTLAAHDGDCDKTSGVEGGCSVQNPVERINIVVLVVLAIIGRMASAWNYTDGNWDATMRNISGDLLNKEGIDISEATGLISDLADASTWQKIFNTAVGHLTSATMQGLAATTSILSSLLIIFLAGNAYFAIDSGRRLPYQSIWVTLLILELIYLTLNTLVWLMSSTSWVRDLSTLKFYIEGKLWGALYLSGIALAIYMSTRRSVNMYGTYANGTANQGADYLTETRTSVFHGKQLSEVDHHCHYIPKYVFDNPGDYTFSHTDCAKATTRANTCCTNEDFDSDQATNGTSVYTGLFVALSGMLLQVVLLIVTAVFHEGGAAARTVDGALDSVNKKLPSINFGVQASTSNRRGFKTIQVV
jgi:hypothetical protein